MRAVGLWPKVACSCGEAVAFRPGGGCERSTLGDELFWWAVGHCDRCGESCFAVLTVATGELLVVADGVS